MRPIQLRLLLVPQVLAAIAALWWVIREDTSTPVTTAPSRTELARKSGATGSAAGPQQGPEEAPNAATPKSAADETRALVLQAAGPLAQEAAASVPLLPPEPPRGTVLPLIFRPVPAHVDLGATGMERLRQLQEGFLRTVAMRPGESADAFRHRWNRAVRLADAQLWPVFGQEVANAFTNARATQP